MKREPVDKIAKFNLDKVIVNSRTNGIVRDTPATKNLRDALASRIAKEPPDALVHQPTLKHTRGFIPTEIQKRMAWQMAAMGASHAIIRLAIIDPRTNEAIDKNDLAAWFGDILTHAREQANFTVALKIYELAIGRDPEYDDQGNMIRAGTPPNLDALKWFDRTRGEARRIFDLRFKQAEDEASNTGVTLVIEGS